MNLLQTLEAEQVAKLFEELRSQSGEETCAVATEKQWEELRNHWLGRKSGVVTLITDNWLKPAAPELKRAVGQEFNKF